MIGCSANLKSHHPSTLHFSFCSALGKFPEKVPFLLPRMLVIAMEVISGTGGNFCFTFEDMMQALSIVLWTMELLKFLTVN
ncbi:hypothetical protein OIU85_016736 [Salix viminalis]|uniref:Uncharacterized protein n=1 Tax=Salix viminalis TaxID=40686 RepID=A0A9Q0ZQ41_SALVM|nr:hypothetical protein OIU85_016736 [Salix viminalis]